MKRLIMTGLALCAAAALAMPTKKEVQKVQPLVNELMSSVVNDYKAKKKTAAEVAEVAEKLAAEAESDAARFLLLKGAVTYYSRAAEYDKAADMVEAIKAGVKDVPPEVLSEIISKATLRISSKNAPRLFAQYNAARALVKAKNEIRTLEVALKKNPQNFQNRREYAELLATLGDWNRALAEFSKLNDKTAEISRSELSGKAKPAVVAEFWWDYKAQVEDAENAIKDHAAAYYRKAINAGELTGLKKALAEQRIAERGTVGESDADAEPSSGSKKSGDAVAAAGDGGCRFKINDNAATMFFPNGVTLEFAKCPAGEFQMVYDFEQNKTAPVKITRPFWFSKTYVLYKHLAGAHPEHQGLQKCLTTPNGGRSYVQNPMVMIEQNLLPRLNVDFKRFFPKGYVVRLPSMAEFQYAYHANSKDRKDPYWLKNPTELSGEHNLLIRGKAGQTFEYGVANKWGINGLGLENILLDRVDASSSARCLTELNNPRIPVQFKLNCYIGKPAVKDPLMWSSVVDAKRVRRVPLHVQNMQYGLATADKYGSFHIVVGPDLVEEWKELQEKKK